MYKPICIIEDCVDFGSYCRRPGHVPPEMKVKKHIAKVSDKKKLEIAALKEEALSPLDKWFEMVATFIRASPKCMNCGTPIFQPEKEPEKYFKAASAHIFPKVLFPSVATHTLNWLILPASCCHDTTHRLDTFSKMKIWNEAVRRFRIFEPHIQEKHRKYYQQFKELADATANNGLHPE